MQTKKPPWKGRPVFDPGPLITKFKFLIVCISVAYLLPYLIVEIWFVKGNRK